MIPPRAPRCRPAHISISPLLWVFPFFVNSPLFTRLFALHLHRRTDGRSVGRSVGPAVYGTIGRQVLIDLPLDWGGPGQGRVGQGRAGRVVLFGRCCISDGAQMLGPHGRFASRRRLESCLIPLFFYYCARATAEASAVHLSVGVKGGTRAGPVQHGSMLPRWQGFAEVVDW
ncbi:hypothetical protein BT67DRAFT_52942 [Trichocladium antarcticum]|uniref:Uncharacterized protein n=1 Tax=Trichocladium antarcticum TaxID=1450529 RepID=A0AAN6UIS5_9PEZI|nr:hypothetical protein BT67DRAFT_52942 [Trichocladium antarcticum]